MNYYLAAIFIVGSLSKIGFYFYFPNIFRPDEIFVNLEIAYRLHTGIGITGWTERANIYSPIFPFIINLTFYPADWIGLSKTYYPVLAATLFSIVSGCVAVCGARLAFISGGPVAFLTTSVLLLFWPDFVYFGSKSLTEVQGGNLLAIAMFMLQTNVERGVSFSPISHNSSPNFRKLTAMFLIGVICGISFWFRFHGLPTILFILIVIYMVFGTTHVMMFVAGFVPLLIFYGVVDYIHIGRPFASIFNNFGFNILEGGSEQFGTKPFFWYAVLLMQYWGGLLILLIGIALFSVPRMKILSIGVLVVLLQYSLIGRKVYSFIFAALPGFICLFSVGLATIVDKFRIRSAQVLSVRYTIIAFVGLLIMSLSTAVSGYRELALQSAGILRAQMSASANHDFCGLGLKWPEVKWYWTGGLTYLGRDVPIYQFATFKTGNALKNSMNYVIGPVGIEKELDGFDLVNCWPDANKRMVCLAKARNFSGCIADKSMELSSIPNLGLPESEDKFK